MIINILGTDYEIQYLKREEADLPDEYSGLCDDTLKKITIISDDYEPDSDLKRVLRMNQTARHEIVHAFLSESGLQQSSNVMNCGWAINEEMVDWISLQAPKMLKVFEEAGVLE